MTKITESENESFYHIWKTMQIEVEYKIGDMVMIVWGDIEYKIIWYEHVPPITKYIILNPTWDRKYCLPIELERKKEETTIWFNVKDDKWENQAENPK